MVLTRREAGVVATAAALIFARVFGLSVVLPGFREHGATLTDSSVLVGTALGAYGLTLALMQLPLGALSDRIGRRPVLLLGTLLFVAGSAWAAVAGSIETLLAARLLQGAGAISSTAMALVGETVAPERRTTAMAFVGIPAGGGFMAGIIAAPLLEPALGFRGLFWATAVLGLATALPLLWPRRASEATDEAAATPSPSSAPAEPGRAVSRPVLALAAAGFVSNYALTTTLFFLPDTSWQVLVPGLLVAVLVMGGASRAIDRAGFTWQPIAIGLPLLAAAGAFHVLSPWLILGAALFFSVHATLSAVLPSQVSRVAGRSGGRGHGVQNIVAYLGTFAAGPIAGAFASSPEAAYAVLGGLALVVAMGLPGLMRGLPEAS
ncbi:MAG: MFS transporter [Thermoplasmatota archaeon]